MNFGLWTLNFLSTVNWLQYYFDLLFVSFEYTLNTHWKTELSGSVTTFQCVCLTNVIVNFSVHRRGSSSPFAEYNLCERPRNKRTTMGKIIIRRSPLFVGKAMCQPSGKYFRSKSASESHIFVFKLKTLLFTTFLRTSCLISTVLCVIRGSASPLSMVFFSLSRLSANTSSGGDGFLK